MSPKQQEKMDLSNFTAEQQAEIRKMLKGNVPEETPQSILAVVKGNGKHKAVKSTTKKRVRTRRMQKVNGFTVLMYLINDNNNIRVQCLEDMVDVLVLPLDWTLAKRAAKALTNYVKAKNELRTYSDKSKA